MIRFIVWILLICTSLSCAIWKKPVKEKEVVTQKAADDDGYTETKEKNKEGAPLPDFYYVDSKMNMHPAGDLPANRPVLWVLFNPGCGHCELVARKIMDQMDKFRDVTILYMCGIELLEQIDEFAKKVGSDRFDNFIISVDNSRISDEMFEYNGIPQMMCYNRDHILQKTFYKDAEIEELIKYLHR